MSELSSPPITLAVLAQTQSYRKKATNLFHSNRRSEHGPLEQQFTSHPSTMTSARLSPKTLSSRDCQTYIPHLSLDVMVDRRTAICLGSGSSARDILPENNHNRTTLIYVLG
jgi:hypothetical protein